MSNNTEYKIQTDLIVYLDLCYPDVLRAVSPSAGFRVHIGVARKMIAMGYCKGTPDIILLDPRGGFFGLAIELKAAKGKLSPEQTQYLKQMRLKKYQTAVCYSYAEAVNTIDNYMLGDVTI